jgi:hypothetical protein
VSTTSPDSESQAGPGLNKPKLNLFDKYYTLRKNLCSVSFINRYYPSISKTITTK